MLMRCIPLLINIGHKNLIGYCAQYLFYNQMIVEARFINISSSSTLYKALVASKKFKF